MESNESLFEMIQKLHERIKYLEEENIENSNLIYELTNSVNAIDRRIDIIAEEFGSNKNV